jgi:hypothetical protein
VCSLFTTYNLSGDDCRMLPDLSFRIWLTVSVLPTGWQQSDEVRKRRFVNGDSITTVLLDL